MSTAPTEEPGRPDPLNGPIIAEAMADWIEWRTALGDCPASPEKLAENLAKLAVTILRSRGALPPQQ